jgi:hypothetical protein
MTREAEKTGERQDATKNVYCEMRPALINVLEILMLYEPKCLAQADMKTMKQKVSWRELKLASEQTLMLRIAPRRVHGFTT